MALAGFSVKGIECMATGVKKRKRGGEPVVLVGTYRPENAAWIVAKRLYNLPLAEGGDAAVYAKFTHVVLYAADAEPLVYTAKVSRVVERDDLKALGYALAKTPRAARYVLFELGEKARAADVLANPAAEVWVCSSRWTGVVDAGFYDRPLPACGGKSIPNIFEKLRPYFGKWKSAQAFNPVQMDFFNLMNMDTKRQIPFPGPKNPKFTFIDLFAGIGGFRIALQRCGGKCVFSSEWDAKAQQTYNVNFGETPFGDITKEETIKAIPENFDILCGGFPCQPFSSIGKRQGFEHPTQGTLFFHIQKILKKHKPKAFILENVPGLITHSGGQTLQTIKDVLRDELSYTMDFKVLNSADFGVPQYRKRLYIIGFREDLPIYVDGEDSLCGIAVASDRRTKDGNVVFAFPQGKFAKKHVGIGKFVEKDAQGPSISKYLQKTYIFKADDGHPEIIDENSDHPVKTLCASYHKIQRLTGTFVRGGETGLRLLTESECKYIMGFPQEYVVPVSRTSMYHQFGNSVAVPVIDALVHEMTQALREVSR